MKDILIYYNKEYKILHAGCQQVLIFLVNRQAVDQTFQMMENPSYFEVSLINAELIGGAGGVLAPPEFRSSVNPIPTRRGRLCPPHYCQHPRI